MTGSARTRSGNPTVLAASARQLCSAIAAGIVSSSPWAAASAAEQLATSDAATATMAARTLIEVER